jgi:uncharacterized protein
VRPIERQPRFVGTGLARRFELICTPRATRPRGTVIHLPAFAEEMNKSRRQVSLTSAALAGAGWRVVQVDLLGCGDSAGDLADASWDAWLTDLAEAIDRHHDRERPLWLWGLRAGALFVTPLLRRFTDANVLLWQPVASGKLQLSQFLRLRTASGIVGGGEPVSRKTIDEELRRDGFVDVAGYRLPADLAAAINTADLQLADLKGRLRWIEVSTERPPTLSPSAQTRLQPLQAAGLDVISAAIGGELFWTSTEIVELPELSRWSVEQLEERPATLNTAPAASAAAVAS